jgi:hypothetical protein
VKNLSKIPPEIRKLGRVFERCTVQ